MSNFRLFVFKSILVLGLWMSATLGLWSQPAFSDPDDQARYELIRSVNMKTQNRALDQAIAAHESPRTTKLYDRTRDEITLDEVEKIQI